MDPVRGTRGECVRVTFVEDAVHGPAEGFRKAGSNEGDVSSRGEGEIVHTP